MVSASVSSLHGRAVADGVSELFQHWVAGVQLGIQDGTPGEIPTKDGEGEGVLFKVF